MTALSSQIMTRAVGAGGRERVAASAITKEAVLF
jgi:hypothetical protein